MLRQTNTAARTMAHAGNRGKWLPRMIISDWDETITAQDTIRLVAEAAYLAKPHYQPSFEHFTNTYGGAYGAYARDFEEKYGARDSIEKERLYQQGMGAVEMTSIDEIVRLGLFKGLSRQQLAQQSSKVQTRPYCWEFLRRATALRIPVVILSVNWSKTIISETLKLNKIDPDLIQILVNDLEIDPSSQLTTGRFDGSINIRTGLDKLRLVKDLTNADPAGVVYIGDSSTDLLSLIEVECGIVIEGGSVLRSLDALGIRARPFDHGIASSAKELYVATWKKLIDAFE